MADCTPEHKFRRHGGEVWTCKCGTVAVTFNGVTVRYSPKDFKRLVSLVKNASEQLLGQPTPAQPKPAPPHGELH
jgi:hypothetical protein